MHSYHNVAELRQFRGVPTAKMTGPQQRSGSMHGRAEARRAHRAALLNINPFLWLVSRERWKPSYVWLYLGAVAGMWLWGWF